MASSQQREKQLMDQNRLSRSLSPFSDGQRRSSPTLSHAPRCPLFISVSMRRTCVSALTVCCCVDLCACVHVCACWLLLQPQTHHPIQRKRKRGWPRSRSRVILRAPLDFLPCTWVCCRCVWQSYISSPYTSARECMFVCACLYLQRCCVNSARSICDPKTTILRRLEQRSITSRSSVV